MISTDPIGAISVDSYLRATGSLKRPRVSPFWAAGLLALTSASAYGLGVWNGKHTEKLSLEAAITVLADDQMPINRRENALGHIYTMADTAIRVIRANTGADSPLATSAANHMRNLSNSHFFNPR
jgi:hypothetical protein